MKLSKFLNGLKPFASVAASFIPGGTAALAVVNAFLPEDKKLPEDSTGSMISAAVDSLPPEQRSSLMEKEIDLKISQEEGWTSRYEAMCKGDGQSTRPKIAMMMAKVLCFEILAFTVLMFWKTPDPQMWVIFGTLTGIPAGILGKYFGELRKEQQNRLGISPTNLLSRLLK